MYIQATKSLEMPVAFLLAVKRSEDEEAPLPSTFFLERLQDGRHGQL